MGLKAHMPFRRSRRLARPGDAQTYRLDCGLGAIANGQFLKDGCEVVLYCLLGDVETVGQLVGGRDTDG